MFQLMILEEAFVFLFMSADIILWLVRFMLMSHMDAGIFENRKSMMVLELLR